jgi:tRNA A37 N6-isopentenylltransferase MiaA
LTGTTGVGLAAEIVVQLAQAGRQTWNSTKIIKIITVDAMQVYAGMDVVTGYNEQDSNVREARN